MENKKHEVIPENAEQFRTWIRERGGVAVWRSINLSNLEQSWSTPVRTESGVAVTKPSWQSGNSPFKIVTREEDIMVTVPKEIKRFRIALRRGDGLSVTLTNHSTERVRRECERAGEGAWYQFDYGTQEAVILVPERTVPLSEWSE